MKNLYILLLLLFFVGHLDAQQHVSGELQTNDTVSLQVIRIFPDSFPRISVVFRASGPNGQSINNLDTTNVGVKENGVDCKVVDVHRISKDWAVNTALVIDHSGSMRMDNLLRRHWDSLPASAWKYQKVTMRQHTSGEVDSDSLIDVRTAPADPVWYHMPLWHAQHAALSYVNQTDATKDKNSLIGFSFYVDVTIPLTHDQALVNSRINGLQPTGETAFYDAVSVALDEADKGDGIRVVIAMTDGKDNNSRQSLTAVIIKAKTKKIPVYVIGLGDVDQAPLRRLARETGGASYFTNEASTLGSIYGAITKEIQSIYEVTYESQSLASADNIRDIQLIFNVDNNYLSSRNLSVILPPEVLKRLEEREAAVQNQSIANNTSGQQQEPEIPWGTGGLVLGVVAAGVLTARYVRNRKKDKNGLDILNIYPNPTNGPITIVLNKTVSGSATLQVTNSEGKTITSVPLTGVESFNTDLGSLENGDYFLSVGADGQMTIPKQVIVTK